MKSAVTPYPPQGAYRYGFFYLTYMCPEKIENGEQRQEESCNPGLSEDMSEIGHRDLTNMD
jgi:hypothetical protein